MIEVFGMVFNVDKILWEILVDVFYGKVLVISLDGM